MLVGVVVEVLGKGNKMMDIVVSVDMGIDNTTDGCNAKAHWPIRGRGDPTNHAEKHSYHYFGVTLMKRRFFHPYYPQRGDSYE